MQIKGIKKVKDAKRDAPVAGHDLFEFVFDSVSDLVLRLKKLVQRKLEKKEIFC